MTRHITLRSITPRVLPFAWLLSAACASTPGAKPEDMSAQEHREAAAEHSAAASEHGSQYDPDARAEGVPPGGGIDSESGSFGLMTYNPTTEHLQHAQKHKKHAADHEAAATALEGFEDAECGRLPAKTRRACPLMGKVVGVEDIDASTQGGHGQGSKKRGIRIRFAEGVNRDAVIAHMRCHIAFGRTQGRKGMKHCPLYVEGVSVDDGSKGSSGVTHGVKGHASAKGAPSGGGETHGPGHSSIELEVAPGPQANTVDLLVEDEALVGELRRRAKAHMPGGH